MVAVVTTRDEVHAAVAEDAFSDLGHVAHLEACLQVSRDALHVSACQRHHVCVDALYYQLRGSIASNIFVDLPDVDDLAVGLIYTLPEYLGLVVDQV